MAVDFLRSCHISNARLVAGSEEVFKIRWFFCDAGAKILPHPTAYRNLTWEYPETDLAGPGPADRVIVWDRGRNRGFPGLAFQGEADWFVHGIPPAALNHLPAPILCGHFHLFADGGLEFDGAATLTSAPGMPALGGLEFGGSGYGAFSITGQGGVEFNSGATFEGPVDLMADGGIEFDGSGVEVIVGGP